MKGNEYLKEVGAIPMTEEHNKKDACTCYKETIEELVILRGENQSLKEHYKLAKDDVKQLSIISIATQTRMDILSGMLDLAYLEIKKLKKIRHCTNCYYGQLSLVQDITTCGSCHNCSKWEAG